MNDMDIQWKKQGRPRGSNYATNLKKRSHFKRSELRMITDPVDALATAVISQWVADGKPSCDMSVWFKIHEECSNMR